MTLAIPPTPVALTRLLPGRLGLEAGPASFEWSLPATATALTVQGNALLAAGATSTGRSILAGNAAAAAGSLSIVLPASATMVPWSIGGFAGVNLLGTAQADTITVTGLSGGWIGTGAGNDTLVLEGVRAGTLVIDTGIGDDTATIRGNGRSTAVVNLGAGADRLTISGMASATIDAGADGDLIVTAMDGNYRVNGGAGDDGLIVQTFLSSVTFGRDAEGNILLRSGSATIAATGIERFRFNEGVLSLEEILRRAGPAPGVAPAARETTTAPPAPEPTAPPPPQPPPAPTVAPPPAPEPVVTPPPPVPPPVPPVRPALIEPAAPTPGDPDGAAVASGARGTGVFSKPGPELLTGTSGNDVFYAGGGDTMLGGRGDDYYLIWDAGLPVERPGEGIDTVTYYGNGQYLLGANVENLTLAAAENGPQYGKHIAYAGISTGSSGVGNELANIITGGGADNILDGRGGNDVLTGGAGKDRFVFGVGYQKDLVTDFRPGEDKVWIVSGALDFAQLRPMMSDSAAGAVIRLSATDTLTLAGRRVAELSARDFSFGVDLERYRLSFAEEFDRFTRWDGRSAPDGGIWRTRMAAGEGTTMSANDGQTFVDRGFKGLGIDPFSVADGALKITGTWRPDLKDQLNGKEFASGVVTTGPSFAQTYGYFEARMKLPDWQGGFPAFWMLPTDGTWPPEIDIMEQIGRQSDRIHQMSNEVRVDTTQYNTYGLEWTPERLAWFVNGQLTFETPNTGFHKPMYMILNYALGGPWSGTVATPAAPGGEVGSVLIDYVRAYELKQGAAPAATRPDGAPLVTYSIGTLAPGGKPPAGDSFTYLASTTGSFDLLPQDFNFASLRPGAFVLAKTHTDRTADSYQVTTSNPWVGMNLQLTDTDGGSIQVSNLTFVDLRLGGSKASSVVLDRVQGGYVQTGAGNDTVAIGMTNSVIANRSTTFEIRTGEGDDRITGWTQTTGRLEAHGGAGNDTITGSNANDLIHGGAGNDLLTGGAGADVFVFARGQGGSDIITDFAPRTDLLRLEGYRPGEAQFSATAGGTLVTLPDGTVLLQGVSAGQVGDWIFQYA